MDWEHHYHEAVWFHFVTMDGLVADVGIVAVVVKCTCCNCPNGTGDEYEAVLIDVVLDFPPKSVAVVVQHQ